MSIPSSITPLFSTGAGGAAGYQIERSLRFNSSDSGYCSRTANTPTASGTWTFSVWIKRSKLGSDTAIFGGRVGTLTATQIYFKTDNTLRWFEDTADFSTTAVFRDVSAWYNFVFVKNGTTSCTIYVNGTQIQQNTTSVPAISPFNTNAANIFIGAIGLLPSGIGVYGDHYLADIHFIDGQALTPSSFTEVSATTGQLIPKAYAGTYTGNSFWLKFNDNSAATAATLGKDSFLLGNNWTPNNLSVTAGAGNDSLVDTPTSYGTDTSGVGGVVRGNYATLNPLNNGGITLSNGNLDWAGNGAGTKVSYGTVAVSSGKWYFEASINGATGGVNWECGIARVGTTNNSRPGATANGWQVSSSSTTTLFKNNSGSSTSIYSSGLSNGDILSVAFDVDNGRIWFARNGTWLEGSPSAGTGASFTNVSGTVAPFGGSDGSGPSSAMNFGQRAFAHTAPSGFKALCDTNLPAPVVAKPNTVMDVKLYTGNGSTQTISGLAFSPDLVWIKGRGAAYWHELFDVVRGVSRRLFSNDTAAEDFRSGQGLTAFNADGFSLTYVDGNDNGNNGNGSSFVAWAWDAGTTTASNTQGSITSQVRANVSAGFSIVSYTGTGSTGTLGHGLGVKPQLLIVKSRSQARDWLVYHSSYGATQYMTLNGTGAAAATSSAWNNTEPTSTVFTIGNAAEINTNGSTNIAYCFAPVVGYSNGFSYTGNGSTDGSFVYLGFRPRLILLKCSSTTGNWTLLDTAREGYNVDNDPLYPNLSNAEGTTDLLDITSNGFKLRTTDASVNSSGATYIGFAWAEAPFAYSRAR